MEEFNIEHLKYAETLDCMHTGFFMPLSIALWLIKKKPFCKYQLYILLQIGLSSKGSQTTGEKKKTLGSRAMSQEKSHLSFKKERKGEKSRGEKRSIH